MNRPNFWKSAFFAAAAALCFVGCSDTALAQNITLTQNGQPIPSNTLNFTVTNGTVSATQTVHADTGNSSTVVVSVSNSSPWVLVDHTGPVNTPTDLHVQINAAGLAQGSYSGSFTIVINGNQASLQTVTVNVTVSGTSLLSASPTSMSFSGQALANFGTPSQCTIPVGTTQCQLTILSSSGTINYNINTTTSDGHPWLLVDRASGSTSGSPVNVGVNPSATPGPGTYTGSITASSTTTSDSVTVSVTLVVGSSAALTATPQQLNFFYTKGNTNPNPQQITVTSSDGAVPFQVTASSSISGWLGVTPQSSAASSTSPATLIVSVQATNLNTGTYQGTITISPIAGTPLQVKVTLIVSLSPFLTISTNQLNFSVPFGNSAPSPQTVTVGSTGSTALNFTASATSDQGWLTVNPSTGLTGTGSATLSIGVNSVVSTLSVGTYSGTVTINPTNGDSYSLQIAVTLTVGAASQLTAAPQGLTFSFQTGGTTPSAQTVALNASVAAVSFTVSTSVVAGATCGAGNWLTAIAQQAPLTTPNFLVVTVNPTGMTPGTCQGTVRVQYSSGQSNVELDIPVTFFVSASPLINISLPQNFGIETTTLQNTPSGGLITRTVQLTSTDNVTAIPYQVSFTSNTCAWLFASPATGGSSASTPTPVQVQILPGCIQSAGVYQGSVTLTSGAGLPSPVLLVITLTVNSNVSIAVTPQALTFNQVQGGSAPAAQTLSFTTSGGNANYLATVSTDFGGAWLSVNPGSGNTSSPTVSVSASSNTLPANTYTGKIVFTFQNAATPSVTIPVRLIIGAPQTISVTPTTLSFTYQLNGPAPSPQQLSVTSTGGSAAFTVGTTSSGGWLSSDTTSGSTPATGSKTVNISVNPSNIPSSATAGQQLTGTVTVNSGILATPITVNVTLNIVSPPAPMPSLISNAASGAFGSIAVGESITIKGSGLGPSTPVSFTVNSSGTVDSTLGGVQVFFDTIAGTPTYVSSNQINVIVPYELAGRVSTNITVKYQGVSSAAIPQSLSTSAPGIFTINATGQGQAWAANLTGPTAGTINGPPGGISTGSGTVATSPAAPGAVLYVLGTGGGQTNPQSKTGSVNSLTTLMPLQGWTPGSNVVTATIGGQPATVLYAGAAAGLVTGIAQFNIQVPTNVSGTGLGLVISVNGVPSISGVTVAVNGAPVTEEPTQQ
jgi:uncharacterized protein (TIGR03437 family)